MELLAPAGNLANFQAALHAGADALYVGAPGLNARNLAKDLSLEQIGAMINGAHQCGKKLYVALNSLMRETDLPLLLETLAFFEVVRPDGLIIQDLGILNLVSRHFPFLPLHSSTLMTVHNRAGAALFSDLGFSKVVIAREYTLKEISRLVKQSNVDVEVFIHGAMCFSYSGLCLFSSYLGGKSGLRGRCVQPCRRKYSIEGRSKPGSGSKGQTRYLFSMNDLNGLEMVSELLKIGVSSLKIEGRLRSSTYVANIVKAYRMVIDEGTDPNPRTLQKASSLVRSAMGRKTSTGYFSSPQPVDAITSYHSGNIGTHLGRVENLTFIDGDIRLTLKPKRPFNIGDRVRLHFEKSGKREGFTVTRLFNHRGMVEQATKKTPISIGLPNKIDSSLLKGPIEVYLVDTKADTETSIQVNHDHISPLLLEKAQRKVIRSRVQQLSRGLFSNPKAKLVSGRPVTTKRRRERRSGGEIWLRVETSKQILGKQLFIPDRYIINFDKRNLAAAGELKRFLGRNMRSLIWSLPPILNDANFEKVKHSIQLLTKSGFRTFQIAHLSQLTLFEHLRVQLFGDYSLNIMNSQALDYISRLDFRGVQLSMEMSKEVMRSCIEGYTLSRSNTAGDTERQQNIQLGLTIYGAPPLFISRITNKQLPYGKVFTSPKQEQFFIEKKEGYSVTRSVKPFSLLPYRRELERMGVDYMVVDLSGIKPGKKIMQELKNRIEGKGKLQKLPTFNYLGTLE